jgi:hypothetical protein
VLIVFLYMSIHFKCSFDADKKEASMKALAGQAASVGA